MPNKSFFKNFFGIFVVAISLLLMVNIAVAGTNLSVTPVGPATRSGDTTIQNITLNLKTKQNWQLYAVPLSNSFKNTSNMASSIPISQAEIQNSDSSGSFTLEYSKPVIIASGQNNGNVIKNFTIRIKTPDSCYPGTYTGAVMFTLVSSWGTSMQNFDISFNQPTIQEISTINNNVNIDVLPENSMQINFSQEAPTPARLYIRSNKDWKLTLIGQNTYNPVAFFFKTLASSGNATLYYSNYTRLSNSNFIIAEGGPTVSSDGKNFEPKTIQVNYKLLTDKYSILTAGSYPYNVVFNLT